MGASLGHCIAHGFTHWSCGCLLLYSAVVTGWHFPAAIRAGVLTVQDWSYLSNWRIIASL
jgi:hypothetical protein